MKKLFRNNWEKKATHLFRIYKIYIITIIKNFLIKTTNKIKIKIKIKSKITIIF